MGVKLSSVFSTTFVGPLPASAAETVILVTPPLNIPLDFSAIIILWMADIIPGTGVSTFGFRIRRGTTTAGAFIGAASWNNQVIAAAPIISSGVYVDTPGAVAGQQYALTVVQLTATAASTFNDGCLIAFAL